MNVSNLIVEYATSTPAWLIHPLDRENPNARGKFLYGGGNASFNGDNVTVGCGGNACAEGDVWWEANPASLRVSGLSSTCYVYNNNNNNSNHECSDKPIVITRSNTTGKYQRIMITSVAVVTTVSSCLSDVYLAGRLSAVHRIQLCPSEHLRDLGFGSHPTGATINNDPYLGAFVVNSSFVGFWWVLYLLLRCIKPASAPKALKYSIKAHTMLQSGVITPALYFAINDEHGTYRGFAIAVLAVYLGVSCALFYFVFEEFPATMDEVPCPALEANMKSVILFTGWRNGVWNSSPEEFADKYGALFSKYRTYRPWVCVVDFALSAVVAGVVSVTKATCEDLTIITTVLFFVGLVAILALHPHNTSPPIFSPAQR